jgi:aryl-alcohol dehydrogenase-like predicted oxidoreductase
MQKRTLGKDQDALEVSAVGLGCIGMTSAYGFAPEALKANMALVDLVRDVATRKGATPAQTALAWLLAQKPWIVPIPGTTKPHRLQENIGAVSVELTARDLQGIDAAASKIKLQGARLPESALKMTGL